MPLPTPGRFREVPFGERAAADEKNQLDDFEETRPLVSPMQ